MTDRNRRDMRELDELAEKAGGLVSPNNPSKAHYNYKKIAEYCKRKGIQPQDLTLRELHQFIVGQ